jgi:hypothetical protein
MFSCLAWSQGASPTLRCAITNDTRGINVFGTNTANADLTCTVRCVYTAKNGTARSFSCRGSLPRRTTAERLVRGDERL